jgi:hypothetical protein
MSCSYDVFCNKKKFILLRGSNAAAMQNEIVPASRVTDTHENEFIFTVEAGLRP